MLAEAGPGLQVKAPIVQTKCPERA